MMFDDAALRQQALLQSMDPPAQVQSARSGEGIGWGPYAALEAGQGADIASTVTAVRNPTLREGNPLGLGGVLASKAAVMAFAPWLMRKLANGGHPTAAKVIGYVIGAEGAVPAAINLHTMAKAR